MVFLHLTQILLQAISHTTIFRQTRVSCQLMNIDHTDTAFANTSHQVSKIFWASDNKSWGSSSDWPYSVRTATLLIWEEESWASNQPPSYRSEEKHGQPQGPEISCRTTSCRSTPSGAEKVLRLKIKLLFDSHPLTSAWQKKQRRVSSPVYF